MSKKRKLVAVITGDVVRSTVVQDRAYLAKVMKQAVDAIGKSGFGVVGPFEILGDLREGQDRMRTEYVLIGTLLSFGIAIGTALWAKALV